jgi:hypothetical protein
VGRPGTDRRKRWIGRWLPLVVVGALGGVTSMVVFGALLPLASADVPASGNPEQVRADLGVLGNQFAGVIRRMDDQKRKVGIGRVRVDAAGLLRTMRQLEAVELRAVDQFPHVFGLWYVEMFAPLSCVARQVARNRNVLGEFATENRF